MSLNELIPGRNFLKLMIRKEIEQNLFFDDKEKDKEFKSKFYKFVVTNKKYFIIEEKNETLKYEFLQKVSNMLGSGLFICAFENEIVRKLNKKIQNPLVMIETLHKLFSCSFSSNNGAYVFLENDALIIKAWLQKIRFEYLEFVQRFGNRIFIIVDESSMIPTDFFEYWEKCFFEKPWNVFLNIRNKNPPEFENFPIEVKFILLGNKNKILPVEKKFSIDKHVFFKNETDFIIEKFPMKNENPLEKFNHHILSNKKIDFEKFNDKTSIILTKFSDSDFKQYLKESDIVLCFKNEDCKIIEKEKRKILFGTESVYPVEGELISFVKPYYQIEKVIFSSVAEDYEKFFSQNDIELVNEFAWDFFTIRKKKPQKFHKRTVVKIEKILKIYEDLAIAEVNVSKNGVLYTNIYLDYSDYYSYEKKKNIILERISYLSARLKEEIGFLKKDKEDVWCNDYDFPEKLHFIMECTPVEYTYASTIHKAVGIKRDTVFVYMNFPKFLRKKEINGITTYQRLLYTACSRARKKLILCEPS